MVKVLVKEFGHQTKRILNVLISTIDTYFCLIVVCIITLMLKKLLIKKKRKTKLKKNLNMMRILVSTNHTTVLFDSKVKRGETKDIERPFTIKTLNTAMIHIKEDTRKSYKLMTVIKITYMVRIMSITMTICMTMIAIRPMIALEVKI